MTYYDDYLEHHGVKGMKWGVRRSYKKERKGAIKDLKKIDKTERKFSRSNKKMDAKLANVERHKSKVQLREAKSNLYRTKGNQKKLAKAKNKLAKKQDSTEKYSKKYKSIEANLNASKARYNRAVQRTADMPLKIKRRELTANVKKGAKIAAKGAATAGLATGLTGNAIFGTVAGASSMGSGKTKRNKKDRFAESVDQEQKRRRRSN